MLEQHAIADDRRRLHGGVEDEPAAARLTGQLAGDRVGDGIQPDRLGVLQALLGGSQQQRLDQRLAVSRRQPGRMLLVGGSAG